MNLFNVNVEEILTFFAVLVRCSVLFSIVPMIGDRVVPSVVKILLALAVSVVLFPSLVGSGYVRPYEAQIWGRTTSTLVGTVLSEVILGLILGYTARLVFDAISIGSNLIGNFIGFSAANIYDPHQESQTEIVA